MRAERFTSGVFLCVIMTFMMSTFYVLVSRKVVQTPTNKRININWEAVYPFKDGSKASSEKLNSFYLYLKGKLENYTSESLLGYYRITEAAKKYEHLVGWNMVSVFDYNAVISLKDGYLTTYTMGLDVASDVASVKGFADFCTKKRIDFMYINFPTKICISEDSDISGVLDFANQNADRFLTLLRDSGVRCYDFRKTLHDDGMKHHEAFFVTDHHWKPETGLWAAGHILKILRDNLGWMVDVDILSTENFEYVIYPEWFLGSQGKKLTLMRAKPDDFTMIYPKFATNLQIKMPQIGLDVSGDFTNFYDTEQIKEKNYYKLNNYCAYTYGDQALISSDNKLVLNAKRLLVVHDSFSDCVIPFLSLGVQYVYAIDLRHFTGSLRTFIETIKPDAVIVEYSAAAPGTTPTATATNAGNQFFDFR